jgi:uncharacterized membrane protein SpoIIM required for sporulation
MNNINNDNMRLIAQLSIILLIFILTGVLASLYTPADYKDYLYKSFSEQAKSILGNFSGEIDILQLPLKIFANNLMVALVIYALSPTIILSWGFYLYQAFMVGAIVSAPALDYEIINSIKTNMPQCMLTEDNILIIKLSLLIPHGLLEIPGISLGLLAGTMISKMIIDLIRRALGAAIEVRIRDTVKKSLKLLLYAAVMLLAAAYIETFITPVVGGLVIAIICFMR